MKRVLFALFGLILAISKVAMPLLLGILLACLLCNIHDGEAYSWVSGIWHGMFFVPNFMRNIVDSEVLYKATNYTTAYNVFWWFVSIIELIFTLPLIIFVLVTPLVALTTPKEDLE